MPWQVVGKHYHSKMPLVVQSYLWYRHCVSAVNLDYLSDYAYNFKDLLEGNTITNFNI